MNCVMISCKSISDDGTCTVKERAVKGNYNCKFENCEHYVSKTNLYHAGFVMALIGESTAELPINPKKFDMITCYKLTEAFKQEGDMFSPAIVLKEVVLDT